MGFSSPVPGVDRLMFRINNVSNSVDGELTAATVSLLRVLSLSTYETAANRYSTRNRTGNIDRLTAAARGLLNYEPRRDFEPAAERSLSGTVTTRRRLPTESHL
jgi:hypothetical protein